MAATSLPEVHSSVHTGQTSWWRRMLAFAGPAYLVSVGYMDPGNWATDLEGGARFGYRLLWVLVLSNGMAILLQTLSARLGIVTQRDLAQACRESYPRPVVLALWVLCEIAIVACDLAEVLGAAIALNLLFHLPLLFGVLLTALDTLLILWFSRLGIRVMESLVLALILTIAACFAVELSLARPALGPIAAGLIPRIGGKSLYVAIAILGATVMPHNLYLHSALVQTRRIGTSLEDRRTACRMNFLDCFVALNGALFVNAAILVLAAAVFFTRGIVVTEIQQAHVLLTPLLGATFASGLFAIALLCSGQSSTLTGTMAGQIVMEGFLNFRMSPWLRRLVTRAMAIVPAAFVVYYVGDSGAYRLIILSQVVLSLQLPFAIIPLVYFTGDRKRMGVFASPLWVRALAWLTAGIVLALNIALAYSAIAAWLPDLGAGRLWIELGLVLGLLALAALLLRIAFDQWLPASWRGGRPSALVPEAVAAVLPTPRYDRILVLLDHSPQDREAIAHAAALARVYGAALHLLHVEEDATSQFYGPLSSTAEVQAGRQYLDGIAASLAATGLKVDAAVRYSRSPRKEIVQHARDIHPDLIILAAHGHKGLKDIVFGTTINAIRHELKVPLLIVRD